MKSLRFSDRRPTALYYYRELQNLRDPATPLAGALRLRRAFGDRARVVTADQGGHGVYFNVNTCANDAATEPS